MKQFLRVFFFIVGLEAVSAVVFVAAFCLPKKTVVEENTETVREAEEDLILMISPQEEIAVTSQYTEYQEYSVKQGDTLWGIAEQYRGNGLDYSLLAERNAIENADLIYEGQRLVIPVDVTEIIMKKKDWFYQHAIPVQPQGSFSIPVLMQNKQTGEITTVSDVAITAQIRTFDLDFKRSGYQLIEATFETDVENIPFSDNKLYFYYEVADRYTGVSFIQNSTLLAESDTNGVAIYELSIRNREQGYAGTVDIAKSSVNNCITIQAEVPKEYDGLVFGFGEYIEVDKNKYKTDVLYTLDQFAIDGTEQYYFSASGN